MRIGLVLLMMEGQHQVIVDSLRELLRGGVENNQLLQDQVIRLSIRPW